MNWYYIGSIFLVRSSLRRRSVARATRLMNKGEMAEKGDIYRESQSRGTAYSYHCYV